MKKLVTVLAILGCAVSAIATAPAASAVDAIYEYHMVPVDTGSGTKYDTIALADWTIKNTAADSLVLLNRYNFDDGWEYVLVCDGTSGGDGDASEIKLELRAYCYANGTLMYQVAVDTVTGTTSTVGEAILLPLGGTMFADDATLKIITRVENGDDASINIGTWSMWKRRPIQMNRSR